MCSARSEVSRGKMTWTVSLEALGKAAPVVPCRVVWMGVQAFQGCRGLDFAICHECVGLDGLKGAFQMVSWGCKSGLHLASIQVISLALKTSICRVTCGPQLSSSLLVTKAQGDTIPVSWPSKLAKLCYYSGTTLVTCEPATTALHSLQNTDHG